MKVIMNLENDEDITPLLRAYSIATSGGIQLPSRLYLDEIAAIMDISVQRAKKIADRYKKDVFRTANVNVRQSDRVYYGLYNAMLELGKTVNLGALRDRVIEQGFRPLIVGDYTFKAIRMTARYGRFKKAFEYTKEYGAKVINSNIKNSQISSIEFIVKIKKGNKIQGASFNIFNTGRVRFSGGYIDGSPNEPKNLVRYVNSIVDMGMNNKPIKINNTTTEIKIAANINIKELNTLLDVGKDIAKFKNYGISSTFEPTRNALLTKKRKNSPFLYVKFGNEFTLLISPTGSIIIEGTEAPETSVKVVREFIDFIKIAGLLEPVRGRSIAEKPTQSKIARRANNQPAPNVTRRGTTCPVGKRPVPYSFQGKCPQGEGWYVRPNPQGQPCCYQIPERPQYLRNKVIERYRNANVKIPDNVRRIFGIAAGNTNNKANNVGQNAPTNLKYVGNKLGSRQCMRYTKVSLVDIASRLGLGLPSTVTKTRLCDMIQKKLSDKKTNVFMLENKPCESYKIATLKRYAREMGLSVDGTKKEICDRIRASSGNANFDYFMNLASKLKNKNA